MVKENKDLNQYEGIKNWEKISIGEELSKWAEKYKSSIALVEDDYEISFEELEKKSCLLAKAFWNIGLRPKDRAVLQLPNSISFVECFFGLLKIGVIPILALPAHRDAELVGIINKAEASAYIIQDKYLGYDYLKMAERLKDKCSTLKHLVVNKNNELSFENSNDNFKILPEINPYDTAILLLSGGTTGIPKLIPRTHSDYLYNSKMAAERCRVRRNTTYLAILPIAHNFSLSCPGILGVLSEGGKVVMCKTSSPDEAMPLIKKHKATITALVPSMIEVFMEMINLDDSYDVSSLKILQVGGAMLETGLAKKVIDNMNCKLMQVFGTAEGLICTTDLEDDYNIITTCQGKSISPYDEIKIVDDGGKEVENGKSGELIVRGPYTIEGYYNNPEANRKSFTNSGFYCTGDKALITKEGNIKIIGRIKEQINRAGEKIMPSQIESILCTHPKVKEAAVVAVPDKDLGNRSCAFLMLEDEEDINLKDLRHYFIKSGIAAYKIPDQVKTIDIWPLTGFGKIDKKKLTSIAENN